MNCIDAIKKTPGGSSTFCKAVIGGTDVFVCANPGLIREPAQLKRVLSADAKDCRMTHLANAWKEMAALTQNGTASNLEYFYDLYDHLYEKEQYPW